MPFDWDSAIYGAIITSVVGIGGFFGKKFLPSERRKAKTDEYATQANIAALMKEKKLSDEDVQGVAALLRGEKRQVRAESILADVVSESKMSASVQVDRYWTQTSMNERASAKFRQSESRLDEAIVRFRQLLDEREEQFFEAAQSAWESYRDRQAEFAAAEVEGGTMAPLVISSEKELMTEARARELDAAFKERADRQGTETE